MSAPEDWFRHWFGETYLSLYPHRDEAEAEAGVRLLGERLAPADGERVLDLACGAGRHLPFLRSLGLWPVGLDLSRPLLRQATRAGPFPLVRGDMRRLPFRSGAFDHLASFFTSFGYFADREQDEAVVAEARRVLRAGGGFLVDYLNAPRVRRTLVPEDEDVVGGRRVRQTRRLEGDTVVKRIEIGGEGGQEPEVHHERVRLYRPDELERLLARGGLRAEARLGGYDGSPLGPDSQRVILVGRAA